MSYDYAALIYKITFFNIPHMACTPLDYLRAIQILLSTADFPTYHHLRVRQQNDPKSTLTWEDSRTQLTSPPKVASPLEGEVPWEIDENEAVEEESDDDDDEEDRFQIPEIRFTSSFQDLTQTSVLLHSYRYRIQNLFPLNSVPF
ncbi:uncharacterized protein TNCV_452261 [Trichonephila clavipes]|nr:uncharacterized protein TNCV_452261 [Trichonephila clavipes]